MIGLFVLALGQGNFFENIVIPGAVVLVWIANSILAKWGYTLF